MTIKIQQKSQNKNFIMFSKYFKNSEFNLYHQEIWAITKPFQLEPVYQMFDIILPNYARSKNI